jgi:hypothetical protein
MEIRAKSVPEAFLGVREYESRRDERPAEGTGSETKPWMIVYAITLGILCIPAVVLPLLTGVVALFS